MKAERIAVCGLGKLGLPLALVFAASDLGVTGYDTDLSKIRLVQDGRSPIVEPEVAEYMAFDHVKNNLIATDSVVETVANSYACLFVTPTPSLADGAFNHHYLLSGIQAIASEAGRQRKRKYLFIIASTVMPGTCDWEITPILNRYLRDLGFGLAYKPEFIALGTVIRDLHCPNVILIGGSSEDAIDRTESLYKKMMLGVAMKKTAKRMTLVEAELAKISLNCAVTMKISFANQVGLVARKLGANADTVLDAVGEDPRVGHLSLRSGLPFGGPCFPRDNRMFQKAASLLGEQAPLCLATDVVNRAVQKHVIEEASATHGDIGVLGLAYKPGTAVCDEAAGIIFARTLRAQGRMVKTHDVMAPHSSTIEEVLACKTVIVACPWPEYKNLTVPKSAMLIDPTGFMHQEKFETLPVGV